MKKMLFLLLLLVSFSATAGHFYQTTHYPSVIDAQKISMRGTENILDICCHYPTSEQVQALKLASAKKIIIRAGAFPSETEWSQLEKMNISYELILSEVFPGDDDIERINKGSIKLLRIISKDFPYLGEVQAFNQFSIPVRFDITKRELPNEEHMIVIRQFKPELTVAFHNDKVPGPGHTSFFNSMPAHKVFVVHERFPYGIDATGLVDFQKTKIEISPSERLMSQDIPILNEFTHQINISLSEVWPMTAELIGFINQIEADEITLFDDGHYSLLSKETLGSFGSSKSKITFRFDKY